MGAQIYLKDEQRACTFTYLNIDIHLREHRHTKHIVKRATPPCNVEKASFNFLARYFEGAENLMHVLVVN